MRKFVCAVGLVLLVAFAASAQEAPKAEVFGGYSYLRVNPAGTTGVGGQNFNGASGSVSFSAAPILGIVADFGGYRIGDIGGSGTSASAISYLFGPKLVLRSDGGRFEPFAQALFGGARISSAVLPSAENGFAMAVGGGVDVKASSHVAIRVIQAEYLMTRFAFGGVGYRQNNARLSFGVVFRIGG